MSSFTWDKLAKGWTCTDVGGAEVVNPEGLGLLQLQALEIPMSSRNRSLSHWLTGRHAQDTFFVPVQPSTTLQLPVLVNAAGLWDVDPQPPATKHSHSQVAPENRMTPAGDSNRYRGNVAPWSTCAGYSE